MLLRDDVLLTEARYHPGTGRNSANQVYPRDSRIYLWFLIKYLCSAQACPPTETPFGTAP